MWPSTKRGLDLTGAALALLLLSPLLLLLVAWIRATSSGPALYGGMRVGRGGLPFRMLKFRTMVANAERLGASSTAGDDDRITPAGRVLRRLKLDELPQLLNVLKGEMSFVGPRPQVQWAVDLYTAEERHLLDVRPGITDFASLKYSNEGEILRGSTDPDGDYLRLIAPGKVRLGLEYVRRSSLLVDLSLIVATVGAVLGLAPDWALPVGERGPVPTVQTLSKGASQ